MLFRSRRRHEGVDAEQVSGGSYLRESRPGAIPSRHFCFPGRATARLAAGRLEPVWRLERSHPACGRLKKRTSNVTPHWAIHFPNVLIDREVRRSSRQWLANVAFGTFAARVSLEPVKLYPDMCGFGRGIGERDGAIEGNACLFGTAELQQECATRSVEIAKTAQSGQFAASLTASYPASAACLASA